MYFIELASSVRIGEHWSRFFLKVYWPRLRLGLYASTYKRKKKKKKEKELDQYFSKTYLALLA